MREGVRSDSYTGQPSPCRYQGSALVVHRHGQRLRNIVIKEERFIGEGQGRSMVISIFASIALLSTLQSAMKFAGKLQQQSEVDCKLQQKVAALNSEVASQAAERASLQHALSSRCGRLASGKLSSADRNAVPVSSVPVMLQQTAF